MGSNSSDILWPFNSRGMESTGWEGWRGRLSKPPKPSLARHAVPPTIAHNRIYFCKRTTATTPLNTALPLSPTLSHPLLFQALSLALKKSWPTETAASAWRRKRRRRKARQARRRRIIWKSLTKLWKSQKRPPIRPALMERRRTWKAGEQRGQKPITVKEMESFSPLSCHHLRSLPGGYDF